MCTKNQILINIYQVMYNFRSSFNTFRSFFHKSTNNYTITLQATDTYPIFGRACSTSSKSPEGEGVPFPPVPGAGKTVHTYISATVENPETFATVVGSCAKFHGEKTPGISRPGGLWIACCVFIMVDSFICLMFFCCLLSGSWRLFVHLFKMDVIY